MAKNWTVAEAFDALQSGDKEARQDIGRRFPLFATSTPEELLAAIPTYVSVRKVEAVLKGDMPEAEEVEDETEEVAVPVKPAKSAKAEKIASDPALVAPAKKGKAAPIVEAPAIKAKGKKAKPAEDDDFDL